MAWKSIEHGIENLSKKKNLLSASTSHRSHSTASNAKECVRAEILFLCGAAITLQLGLCFICQAEAITSRDTVGKGVHEIAVTGSWLKTWIAFTYCIN